MRGGGAAGGTYSRRAAQLIVQSCIDGDLDKAHQNLEELWAQGYSAVDIITTLFRVVKYHTMAEFLKLEFLRVRAHRAFFRGIDRSALPATQEIGFAHMRIVEGVGTLVQLSGLVARMCKVAMPPVGK